MLVKANVQIKFNCDKQEWEGVIEIYLPADDEGRIVPELRSTKCVFGYSLHKEVGSLVGGFRRIWRIYRYNVDITPEKILEDLEGKLKEKIEVIKSIYKQNSERMRKSVQKEYEFSF